MFTLGFFLKWLYFDRKWKTYRKEQACRLMSVIQLHRISTSKDSDIHSLVEFQRVTSNQGSRLQNLTNKKLLNEQGGF